MQAIGSRAIRASALVLAILLVACQSDEPGSYRQPPVCSGAPAPTTLAISGYTPGDGIFDPSLTEDACNRIWMSYSAVNNFASGLRGVHARIARGNSAGSAWDDMNIGTAPFNTSTEDEVSATGPLMGTWEHEVSRLVYDPYTSNANMRWKLIWHRYRFEQTTVGSVGESRFTRGWIALSTAPNATGPWSLERKLFVGGLYDLDPADKAYNDSFIGPPEYELDNLFSELASCLVFTEPGALATASGIYVSLKCATGAGGAGDVLLVRCDNEFSAGSCSYRGKLLVGAEASTYNDTFGAAANSFDGFSATELVRVGAINYLLVTPTESDIYRGCLAFQITSLDNATLERASGVATLQASLRGTPSSFNGACGYTANNTALGILYSEYFPGSAAQFRILPSGTNL